MNDYVLCELVSKYKCLYDLQDKNYKDQNMKDNAWEKVADNLKQPGKNKQNLIFFIILS